MHSQELINRRTNGTLVAADCGVSNLLDIENDCPSSGWQAIEAYLAITNGLIPLGYPSKYRYTPSPAFTQVIGHNSLRQLRVLDQKVVKGRSGYDASVALATIQQAAVADALSTTGALWNEVLHNMTTRGHGSILQQLNAAHSINTGCYQPYAAASCEADIVHGYEDSDPVAFPPTPEADPSMLNTSNFNDLVLGEHAFVYSGITRSQILNTVGFPGDYRLRWVELPQYPFNGTSIGAVVLLPRAPDNMTQEVLMCTLSAGWGASKLNTSTYAGGSDTVFSEEKRSDLGKILQDSATGSSPATEQPSVMAGGYFSLPFFPQNIVTVTEDWAQYLNPNVSGSNFSVFHHLMASHLLLPPTAISAKIILASLLSNGLARIGSTSRLQGTVKTVMQPDGSEVLDGDYWFSGKGDAFIVDPVESRDWVKLRVHTTIEGFAYNTRGATPKVAICFLLAYCVFALAHILYAGITGISSTCWDSIGEVTALAVNSTPSALLRNTCAGITELSIFKIPVRVLAFRDNENSDGEHLELVFGDLDEKTIEHQVIKHNRVYGTMPLLAGEKKKNK